MKLFVDSANLQDIEAALKSGVVRGITTNPSLLAKEPEIGYLRHMKKVVSLAKQYKGKYSLSIEVFKNEPREIITQAKQFIKTLSYPHLAIKIHVSHGREHMLDVIHSLARQGIAVNCTVCMTPLQAVMASAAGARYVSIFYNRLREGGKDKKFATQRRIALKNNELERTDFEPEQVITQARQMMASYPETEIIAGSVRSPVDIKRAGLAGAHIVTAPWRAIRTALFHYKTSEAVDLFFGDLKKW